MTAPVLFLVLAAAVASPFAVGAFNVFPYALLGVVAVAVATYALGVARSRLLKRVALVTIALCVGVTLVDLAIRPMVFTVFDVRVARRFIDRWPPLPLLQRYAAGVDFQGTTHGDLAGRKTAGREDRRIRFVTDAYGFRNEPSANPSAERALDVIVLGDSFGVASSTTQDDTLSSVLARDYRLSVYNLSVSGDSPRQEYANLVLEGARLKTRPDTRVLWMLFPGNDLDEPYASELEDPRPNWPNGPSRLVGVFQAFRARSPVRRLLTPGDAATVIEKTFVDGRPLLFFAPYAQRRHRTADQIARLPNFERLKATLDAMERLARSRQFSVAVAIVPSKDEVYSWLLDDAPPWSSSEQPSGFSTVLRELSEPHGFGFVDLKPALVQASRTIYETSGGLVWWRDDSHWNDAGQRVAAQVINDAFFRDVPTP